MIDLQITCAPCYLLGCVRLHLRHLRPRSLRCVRLVAVAGGLRTSETLGIYGLRVGEGVATEGIRHPGEGQLMTGRN